MSVNLDGITLLFINAHLAGGLFPEMTCTTVVEFVLIAHEGRVMDRVANMTKIKVSNVS